MLAVTVHFSLPVIIKEQIFAAWIDGNVGMYRETI